MRSNQRGPVIFFAALFGLIFLCLCLVVGAVAISRLSDAIAAPAAPRPVQALPTPVRAAAEGAGEPAAPSAQPPAPIIIDVQPGADVEADILRAVYRKVNASVVKVVSLSANPFGDLGFDLGDQGLLPQGQGSGFIWSADGFIVTNAHVVENADQVQIIFYDDTTVTGEVIGADSYSDLAVIEIDPTGLDLAAVERGDIDQVQVGDRAIAIGAPFDFAGSMTAGTVSGLGRSISSLNVNFQIPEVIQTDAAINPGNSGGPLLDAQGRVIGINAQIRSEGNVAANSGVGFAIPVYIAERVVPALIDRGRFEHAFIGLSGRTYSPEWADALGFSPDDRGAYVVEVISGEPAARAGLRGADQDTDIVLGFNFANGDPVYLRSGGDLIYQIDSQPVRRFDDLLIHLFRYASPGDTVDLAVLRADGSNTVIPVELGVRPGR